MAAARRLYIKSRWKKNREITNLVPLSFLEQLHFSSHKSREEFYLGVRNRVLLQGCFYVLLDWLARSIFF